MAKKKLNEDEKEEAKREGELPKKSIRKNEEKQLLWFFIIIGLVFAGILIPYFYSQSTKSFEYANADWLVEDYESGLTIFHGRFASFANPNLFYNTYLRGDPRENEIQTSGTFENFKYGGVVSLSPKVNECRGELPRVMFDLGAFLRQGIGVGDLETGTTDKITSIKNDIRFSTCETVQDKTLVIVDMGNESKVIQDEKNNYCYTIYIEDCNDIAPVEKFIAKSINDMGNKRINLTSSGEE